MEGKFLLSSHGVFMQLAQEPDRHRLGFWLGLSLLSTNLLVLGISLWALSASLQRYREEAGVTARNLAVILEQNLSGHIRLIDLTLLQLLDEANLSGSATPPSPQRLAQVLEHHQAQLPLLRALKVTDASGRLLGGIQGNTTQSETIADRPYFHQLRDQKADALVISPPIPGRSEHEYTLIFARARRDRAGHFKGVLFGEVPLQAFDSTLAVVDTGPHGSIAVRDGDHRLVTRHPRTRDQEARIGQQVSTPEYLKIVRSPEGFGTFRKPSPVDGLVRTWTVRRAPDQPFSVVIGLAESDYLAPWRRECAKAGVTFLGSILLTMTLGHLLLKAWKRRQATQEEKERLIGSLQQALVEVKELKGLLPICSACKKIRDDQGYWNQMETYISNHTDATFTHGLCPECMKDYFPGIGTSPSKPSV
jgi:hypothetical protein